jgi:hypothetical protein
VLVHRRPSKNRLVLVDPTNDSKLSVHGVQASGQISEAFQVTSLKCLIDGLPQTGCSLLEFRYQALVRQELRPPSSSQEGARPFNATCSLYEKLAPFRPIISAVIPPPVAKNAVRRLCPARNLGAVSASNPCRNSSSGTNERRTPGAQRPGPNGRSNRERRRSHRFPDIYRTARPSATENRTLLLVLAPP